MSKKSITRREMVKRASLLGGSFLLSSSLSKNAFSAKEEGNIKWALGMYTWVVFRRPDPVSLKEVLSDSSRTGFDGVECFQYDKLLKDNNLTNSGLKDLFEQYNLQMTSVYEAGAFHDRTKHADLRKTLRKTCENLKFMSVDNLVIGPPGYKGPDEKGTIKEMCRFLDEIGKMTLEEYNIKIGIHPHLNTVVENPRQLAIFMDNTDPRYVFIVPDAGHIWLGGGDPVKIFDEYKERISYVHYKDAMGYVKKPGFFDNVTELGRGAIDFPAIQTILKKIHYKGWIVIDLDFVRESPLVSAQIHRQYISEVLDPIYK